MSHDAARRPGARADRGRRRADARGAAGAGRLARHPGGRHAGRRAAARAGTGPSVTYLRVATCAFDALACRRRPRPRGAELRLTGAPASLAQALAGARHRACARRSADAGRAHVGRRRALCRGGRRRGRRAARAARRPASTRWPKWRSTASTAGGRRAGRAGGGRLRSGCACTWPGRRPRASALDLWCRVAERRRPRLRRERQPAAHRPQRVQADDRLRRRQGGGAGAPGGAGRGRTSRWTGRATVRSWRRWR